MHDFLLAVDTLDSGAELEQAAGVGGDDDFGFYAGDVFHFVVEQLERCFGFCDVVNAGGAATDVGVREFDEFEAGYLFQKIARGVADLLSVKQMAGILISDAEIEGLERAQRRGESKRCEIFSNISHFGFERGGLRKFGFAFVEEVVVFLERGAAAGGVGDDRIEFVARESDEIFAGEVAGGVADSRVGGERSAALLGLGNDDFDAVGVEDANGGVVESRESDLCDASGEEGDATAFLSDGGIGAAELLEEEWSFDFWQELFAVGETEEFEHAAEADEALETGTLVEPNEAREHGDAIGVRKKFAECEIARDAGEERTLVVALDERAGVLDEHAVLNGRRAGGFAGAAVEAFVDVLDEGFCDLRASGGRIFGANRDTTPGSSLSVGWRGRGVRRGGLSLEIGMGGADIVEIGLGDVDHLVDAAARGVSLEIPKAIGGASVETDAAVDAAGEIFVRGILAGDWGSGGHLFLNLGYEKR